MGCRGSTWTVTLLLLSSQFSILTAVQHSRHKRQILPDQPRIITQGGHLIFQSGTNHNITFRSGNGGGVFLGNTDLNIAVSQIQSTKQTVNNLKVSYESGSANLTTRVSTLEGHVSGLTSTGGNYQTLSNRISSVHQNLTFTQNHLNMRVNSLEQSVPPGSSISTMNGRIANITARVQTLEAAVQESNDGPQHRDHAIRDLLSRRTSSGGSSSSSGRPTRRRNRNRGRVRGPTMRAFRRLRNRSNNSRSGSSFGRSRSTGPSMLSYFRLRNRVSTLETTVQNLQSLLETNECASNPCLNGGSCVDMYNGFMCKCPQQWQGPRCTQDVNECSLYAGTTLGCQNGATCQNTHGGFVCHCTSNYHGIHCRETHNDCTGASSYELCGHGTCVNRDRVQAGQARYTCICEDGWTNSGSDPACVVDVNECNGNIHCSVDPYVPCINSPGSYYCGSCPSGYEGNGYTCADVNECQYNNGGCSMSPPVDCINTRGSSACGSCPSGYQGNGRTCSFVGLCTNNNGGCYPQAQCYEDGSGTSTVCTCPSGYVGSGRGPNGCIPQAHAGGCVSNPCLNGATCQPAINNNFICTCAPGYTGYTCATQTNACASNPCRNGGTCTSAPGGSFTCACTSNYTGATCEEQQAGCGEYLPGSSGTFRSHEDGQYSHNTNCAWVITTDPSKTLRITFPVFHLEYHPSCNYDFLQIHDGPSASAYMIGKYCGTDPPNGGSINSTSNQLYFWFKTDASAAGDGFQVDWTSHDPVCGGHYNVSYGEIDSPGYPGNYPVNRDCVWTIAADPGQSITFAFAHVALEEHSSCNYDFLEIRDGQTETSTLLRRLCTDTDLQPVHTTGPFAFVRFHSDSSHTARGFHLTFHATGGCGESLTGNEGSFQSPNYPSPYNHNDQCVWTITTDPNTMVQLTFTAFDLEAASGCVFDSLTIRDGSDQTAPLLARLCADDIPAPIRSTGNVLFVELRTDETEHGSGFQAHWSTDCGGAYTGMSGQIMSPGWPNVHPHEQQCVYTINVPEMNTVKLNITDFDLEYEEDCVYDYVEVYDGGDTSAPLMPPRLCGELPSRIFRSTGSSLTVKFVSDISAAELGFRATYEAEESSGDTECGGNINGESGFVVRNSGIPTPPGTECEWIITVSPGSAVGLIFHFASFLAASDGSCGSGGLTIEDMVPQGQTIIRNSLGTYCGTNRPPSVTSTSNQIAIKMTAQNNSVAQYFTATYYTLNVSADCGAELTDEYGVIQSPDYPKDYPHNIMCVWTITLPQNHQIRLNVTDFDIEHATNCQYDYLEIRNGGYGTSPLMQTYCGNQVFFSPIISHSNRVRIKFVTDANSNGRGFSINYDSGATGCGGDMTTPTGGFTSPNYPSNYDHNSDCQWTITVSRGSRITLSFDAFHLEHYSNCLFDYVMIREGSETGDLVATLCGDTIPSPVVSTTNRLYIRYRSDASVAAPGFSASYITTCNNNMTGHTGVIESPNFPNAYPHYADCTWVITVPPGNKINVSFASFNLELETSSCGYDKLEVIDGAAASDTVLQTLCGHSLPERITSSGSSLRLHFTSDYSYAYQGFRLEWVVDGCGGPQIGSSGTLNSPGYPANYPHDLQCDWTIQVPLGKKIKLTINDFRLETSASCQYDALEVYLGDDASGHRIGQFCHASMPSANQVITSTGSMLFVRFYSDSSAHDKGFHLTWEAVDGGCGGTFSVSSATFVSPNYPNGYAHNLDCEWLIQVLEGHTVQLTFNAFDVESNYDHVRLYDGRNASAPLLSTLTGSTLPNPVSYRSNSNIMLVRLTTDYMGPAEGFNVTYTTACGGTLNADVDGVIESPHDDYQLTSCVWHINSQIHSRRVSLMFTSFDIQGNCEYNYLALADTVDSAVTQGGEVQQSHCGSVMPAMYTSSSSSLTVVLNTTHMYNANFRAVYTSTDNACGGNTNAISGRFTTPSYPDFYPTDTECVWQVTTAPGNSLLLSFAVFELDPTGGFYDDYVEIYTPDLNGQLMGRWYGNNVPSNLTGMSGFWIKFRSNDDEFRGLGFSALWNTASTNALTGNTGQIGSPGQPYPNNANFRWTILAEEGMRIRIFFSSFDVERGGGSSCIFDFLQIFDGPESDGVSLGLFCGNELPAPVVSVNNLVSLWFHTDTNRALAGFLLTWEAVPSGAGSTLAPSSATVMPTSSSACGTQQLFANFTDQNLTSPNHPSNYDASLDCYWTISVPWGHKLRLIFDAFNIESHSSCNWDYIKIYDGGFNGQLLGMYCGTTAPGPILSDSNVIAIRFHTDYIVQRSGFKLVYRQACGGTIVGHSGIITSPAYPEDYPEGKNCTWTISVPDDRTILLNFNDTFNIASGSGGNCGNDYLQLYNGFGSSAPPLVSSGSSSSDGRYCGSSAPPTLETGSNRLTAQFISDNSSSVTGAGFSFTFTEKHLACGGQLSLLNGMTSGYFTSPNYPSDYPRNVDCQWVIIAPAEHRVRVDFEGDFKIEVHSNCVWDYVAFHDGGTENSPAIGDRLCGDSLPSSVVSTGNILFARFVTDGSETHVGFKAKYSIATCGGRIAGMGGVVQSPNFPQNYGPNLNCFWVLQGQVGHYLTVNVTTMRLYHSSSCDADVLDVIDPASGSSNATISEWNPMASVAVQGMSVSEAAANASGEILYRSCSYYSTYPTSVDTADNRAYVWFKSDDSGADIGFRMQFGASVEECGGDLTAGSGVLSSPNYPGTYPHRRVCTWTIRAPVGRKVTLTFTDFALENPVYGRCMYDFVVIKNGELRLSPMLARLCGTALPSPISSSGSTMKVIFYTDHSITHGGFRATYNTDMDAECGGLLTEAPGNITSPNFTFARDNNYNHGVQCIWRIHNAAQNSSIRIRITHFDLEYHIDCRYDFLQIREGVGHGGQLINTFCGNRSTNRMARRTGWRGFDIITIPTPDAWIAFVTDASIAHPGFRLEYNFTDCGGVWTAPSGVITSPNFPEDYLSQTDCAWLLQAPEGMVVRVNFTHFLMERHRECSYDYVMLQNGGDYDSPVIGKYCSNETIPLITSTSSQLRIVLSTDWSVESLGFRLEYSFVQSGCGGHLSHNQGSLASPNHPSSYPDDSQCQWDIRVETGYHIDLTFNPPFDVSCDDFVKVNDIHANGSVILLGSYCHNEVPPVLHSSSNEMQVIFQSDGTTNGNGFSADYSAGCGAFIDSDRASLYSPGYPGYSNNLRCNYTLSPGSDKTVILRFRDLQMEGGAGCPHDFLKIYQGADSSGSLLATHCSDIVPERLIARGTLFLDFKTDYSHTYRGFSISYRAEECGGMFTSSKGYFQTPAFPHEYHNNANCVWNITVEPNKIVVLRFGAFELQASYGCYADYVAIYDGNSTDAPLIGKYCGTSFPTRIRSTGNSLYLNLITNYYNTAKGLRASYYSSYGPSAGCGGTLQQASGTIQSLDMDGEGNYEAQLDCEWTIIVEPNNVILINITDFVLEDASSYDNICRYDYLKVYDGATKSDHMLLFKCGSPATPIAITSSSNTVLVRFVSDGHIEGPGFNLTYAQQEALCGGVLNATTQEQNLTSPGYPGSSDMTVRCRWTVDSGANYLQVQFQVLSLQLSNDCREEYLDISDKPMGTHGMKQRACGSVLPHPFFSRRRQATVIFHQESTSSLGFLLTYKRATCDRTYIGAAGRITTPLFPATYDHHLSCSINVQAPEGSYLTLYFEVFHMESHYSCSYDFMRVTTPDFNSGKLCGDTVPAPMFLSNNTASIQVSTDYSVAYVGFAITYLASTTSSGCGGNLTNAIPGIFTSPQFPSGPSGPLDCTYSLSSPSPIKLTVLFLNFPGGGGDTSCQSSYLEIVHNGLTYGKMCSSSSEFNYRIHGVLEVNYFVAANATATTFKMQFKYNNED